MIRPLRLLLVLGFGIFLLSHPLLSAAPSQPAPAPLPDGLYARIETPRGLMVAELDFQRAPLTVCNFVGLAEGWLGPKPGSPFFDGLRFHRVVPGFVIQGGDPLGTGEGGPGYEFPDEFCPGLRHGEGGALSMANAGPDTNGSQFFITLGDCTRLNYLHSVFGRLVSGAAVSDRIQSGDTMRVSIVRVGAAARAFAPDRSAYERLLGAARRFGGQAEPGPGSAFFDPSKLLPSEVPRARNFNIKLLNFTRATGLVVRARLHPVLPAGLKGLPPQEALAALAKEAGVPPGGAFLLYVRSSASWRVLAPQLSPEAIETLGQAARQRTMRNLAAFAEQLQSGQTIPPAQRLKLETDAWLDELLFALEGTLVPAVAR